MPTMRVVTIPAILPPHTMSQNIPGVINCFSSEEENVISCIYKYDKGHI
jgi:hypothetical protein